MRFIGSITRACFFCIAVLCASSVYGASLSTQSMLVPRGSAMYLMPYLDYCIDDSFFWDIEEAAAAARSNNYKPLVLDSLPREEGVIWLRFVLAPALSAKPATYLLDMGLSIPGTPALYVPERNELSGTMEWREALPAQNNILLLPEPGSEPMVCYIRLEGFPGPWFAPVIRSPQNAAGNWGSLFRTGAILALGVVMLLCLLRGMSENGQWRVWTALYVGIALIQAALGMPAITGGFNLVSFAATLTPGIALMLLPHVGRHLMRTPIKSKSIDIQLLLLSLPGAALALLPLIPGFVWLCRWLELWPLGIAIFIPTAIGAWVMGLAGARRFLFGAIIPPLFTIVALLCINFGFPSNILASAPCWGIAISALLIAATRAPLDQQEDKNRPEQTIISPPMQPSAVDTVINLRHPLDDPNLRLVTPDEVAVAEQIDEVPEESEEKSSESRKLEAGIPEKRELVLRSSVDDILRESVALGKCSLPAAAREYTEKIIASSERMAEILSLGQQTDLSPQNSFSEERDKFNLQRLLREAHDYASQPAEQAGLALSWYIPPHLEQDYTGDAAGLVEVLKMLLESSIRSTKHGSIHLSARRVPESLLPGHVLFSITDTGTGFPPLQRSSVALARTWEYAAKNGGYLGMESDAHGCVITFSVHFTPVDSSSQTQKEAPHVILVSDDEMESNELTKLMTDAGYKVNQAKTVNEVLVCQRLTPASLLIASGRFARPAAADMAHEFADLARRAGFDKWHILAITADDSEWSLLKPSGFTHAMIGPVEKEAFMVTVQELISSGKKKSNSPSRANEDSAKSGNILIDLMDETYSHISQIERATIIEQKPVAEPQKTVPAFEGPDWLYDSKEKTAPDNSEPDNSEENSGPEVDATKKEEPINSMETAQSGMVEHPEPAITEPAPEPQPNNNQPNNNQAVENNPAKQSMPEQKPAPDSEKKTKVNQATQDPIILALVHNLDSALAVAIKAAEAGNTAQVAVAAGRIAQQAESFNLRVLTRIAQTVERAASAPDLQAVRDILPELANAVERNSITLTQKSAFKSSKQI